MSMTNVSFAILGGSLWLASASTSCSSCCVRSSSGLDCPNAGKPIASIRARADRLDAYLKPPEQQLY